jgi:uncharacterized integral membrane protein (TIGR00698 family)
VLVAVAVVASLGLARLVPAIGGLTWAVLLGVLAVNAKLLHSSADAGTRWATRRTLRFGVVLLGLQLAVPQVLALGPVLVGFVLLCVVATFYGTRWLGRRLGLSEGTSLMVATGFSICGASAIAAMDGVAEAEDDDVATGIGLVTVCGTLAIFALPWLGAALSLSAKEYGVWAGASVHEVAQVVAAAAPVPGALAIAVVVKLTRVVLLAPMVALESIAVGRRQKGFSDGAARRPPLVPLFVLCFLAMVVLRSVAPPPQDVLDGARLLADVALAAALFGLGTGVHVGTFRRTGVRALALGLASWLLIGMLALAGAVVLA